MKIISHRGYWKELTEKNSEAAFRRSFTFGFGTETDLRDMDGEVVISHDPPRTGAMDFSAFLQSYQACGGNLPLALNIKADGLQAMVKNCLERFSVSDYFVFDMSVPDLLGYHKAGIPFYTRMSEHERIPVLLDEASGVWLDAFDSEWYQDEDFLSLARAGKSVCIVSPELHRRQHLQLWQRLRNLDNNDCGNLILCTDCPEDARTFILGAS
jgi:hypothetical protein